MEQAPAGFGHLRIGHLADLVVGEVVGAVAELAHDLPPQQLVQAPDEGPRRLAAAPDHLEGERPTDGRCDEATGLAPTTAPAGPR